MEENNLFAGEENKIFVECIKCVELESGEGGNGMVSNVKVPFGDTALLVEVDPGDIICDEDGTWLCVQTGKAKEGKKVVMIDYYHVFRGFLPIFLVVPEDAIKIKREASLYQKKPEN